MAIKSKLTSEEKIVELQERLNEAEDTLEAIRVGSVDALVVKGPSEQQIYTLKSADYMYRMLIESMNQGALTLNFDGTILYSNKQFGAMLQAPLEKIIGCDIFSFIAPNDHKLMRNIIKGAKKADLKLELNLLRPGGAKLTVIASATVVSYEENKPYLCVVVTDMTERKQAEEAKDEFISLASHQLRTPATSVKQYIHMVIGGFFGELNEAQRDALIKANDSNERELMIVEDLLKVAQIDAGKVIIKRLQVDLDALLKNIITEQSEQLKLRGQQIHYFSPSQPIIASIDENLMRMVIENLIDNASKYMTDNKTITIKLRSYKSKVELKIIDQGIGMKKQDISKLFQKFTRLPNSLSIKVGGTGLGLYWAKKVIDLHNAEIIVSSVLGKGTEFTISLPKGDGDEHSGG
jgi:two-component system sensor histidine kinase VicK